MFKLFYFIGFLISTNFIFGQDYTVKELNKLPTFKQDTLKIKSLIDTGDNCYYTYPDSSYIYYNKALEISKLIKSKKFEALSLLNIGYYLDEKERYAESLELYLRAIECFESINDESGIAKCYNYIGYSFAYINSIENSMKYYYKALKIYKKLKDQEGISDVYNGIGNLHYEQEDYAKAHEFYLKAYEIYLTLDDKAGINAEYINIGNAISDQGRLDEGMEYYFKSIKLSKELDDKDGLAINYVNLGDCYIVKENYNKAAYYLDKSLVLSQKIGYKNLYPYIYSCIAHNKLMQKKYDEVILNVGESLKFSKKATWVDLSGLENHKYLSIAYEKLGDYKKAYENHKIFKKYNDSIFNLKKVEQIAKLNALYQLEDKEDKINGLIENEKVRVLELKNHKILTAVLIGCSSFFLFLIFLLNKRRKERNNAYSLLSIEKERAEENEALYFGLFNNSTIGLYQTTPDGEILSANKSILKMLRFNSLEDLLKRDLTKGSYVNENKRIEFKAILEEKGVITDFESEWFTKNGEIITVLEGAKVIRNAKGEIIRYDGAVLDITDKKKTELKLIESMKKAKESDQLKSAFLANMSHEIRTPMNAIMGFSSFLKNPQLNIEKRNHFVDIISDSGERLLAIINDIIDISKIESNQLKIGISNVNVNKTLEEIVEIQKQTNTFLVKNNVEIILNITKKEDDIFIKTDKNRFLQIFNNLINNASKFTKSGQIELGYKLAENTNNSYVEFYVKDSGCGIPEGKLELIFDRFSQAGEKDFETGNGLGLSICKGLLVKMKGEIWVESEVGVGTIFHFKLPY